MGLVQIGVKVDTSIKERIKSLVDEGKYRDMTDFAVRAICEKLERDERGFDPEERIKELLQKANELEEVYTNHEERLRQMEKRRI